MPSFVLLNQNTTFSNNNLSIQCSIYLIMQFYTDIIRCNYAKLRVFEFCKNSNERLVEDKLNSGKTGLF